MTCKTDFDRTLESLHSKSVGAGAAPGVVVSDSECTVEGGLVVHVLEGAVQLLEVVLHARKQHNKQATH